MNLIVVNYSMSANSQVFAHQRETVLALSRFFDSIEVFTSEVDSNPLPKNVKVNIIPWDSQSRVKNGLRILQLIVPVLVRNRESVIFSHMTDVHAAIISPLAWLLKIRHVLWYAHATNSRYLVWSSFFVSRIVSSTQGSCNLKFNRGKISFIDQGIDQNVFTFKPRFNLNRNSILYYGRLDPSKNIHVFPELINALKHSQAKYSLDIFGKPTGSSNEKYLLEVSKSIEAIGLNSSIFLHPPIRRSQIPVQSMEYDLFINLFVGSLDKSLIEATFLGLPVVTWNLEYCLQFGTWSGAPTSQTIDFILLEFAAIRSMASNQLSRELKRRFDLAVELHSFVGWIRRLVGILQEGKA